MAVQKIATCCYCGTRAALVLAGETRHELACSTCGAPLHDLKMLPKRHPGKHSAPLGPSPSQRAKPSKPKPAKRDRKPQKKKKKRSFASRLFSEAIDVIEDIFD